MKVGKPQSKRTPVRLRHKIQKASAAKQKKSRKDAKKNPQWKSRLKKDPGIPNLFPFKAQVLAEIEETKRKKEEEQQRRRDIAKSQREGWSVAEKANIPAAEAVIDDDEELIDREGDDSVDDVMDGQEDSNPMAALLASAQARAKVYDHEDEDDEDSQDDDEWDGIDDDQQTSTPAIPTKRSLPQQALADPTKAVTALLNRLQKTTDGIQQLIDYYEMPPLMTAGSDITSGFLVEVARKRGRLGKGGIPNLHSAALIVLGDLNEERLVLPALATTTEKKTSSSTTNGEVRIVKQLAQPFRLEGLWEDDANGRGVAAEKMIVDV